MATYNQYDDNTKAAAISRLLNGDSAYMLSDELGIPVGTLKSWKSQAVNGGLVTTEKQNQIGSLLIDLLHQELKTLSAIAEAVTDRDWIREQRAQELAVLYGVMQDKMVKKVEVLKRAAGN